MKRAIHNLAKSKPRDLFNAFVDADFNAASSSHGKLHDLTIAVKDNIATKDKMETTAGSYALLGSIVPRDSHVVHRLRSEGALLLGHAALSEWADMRSNIYSEGYSARGGQCRSAYNLTVNPGGSSSGSAVGVAANVIAFALGTETDGSGASSSLPPSLHPTIRAASFLGRLAGQHMKTSRVRDIHRIVYGSGSHRGECGSIAKERADPDKNFAFPMISSRLAVSAMRFSLPPRKLSTMSRLRLRTAARFSCRVDRLNSTPICWIAGVQLSPAE